MNTSMQPHVHDLRKLTIYNDSLCEYINGSKLRSRKVGLCIHWFAGRIYFYTDNSKHQRQVARYFSQYFQ